MNIFNILLKQVLKILIFANTYGILSIKPYGDVMVSTEIVNLGQRVVLSTT